MCGPHGLPAPRLAPPMRGPRGLRAPRLAPYAGPSRLAPAPAASRACSCGSPPDDLAPQRWSRMDSSRLVRGSMACGPHGSYGPRARPPVQGAMWLAASRARARGLRAPRGPRPHAPAPQLASPSARPLCGTLAACPPAPAAPQLASRPPFLRDMRPWASPAAPPWRGRETNVSRETYPHRVSPSPCCFPPERLHQAPTSPHRPHGSCGLHGSHRPCGSCRPRGSHRLPAPPAARVACSWVALRFFGLRCKFSRFCTRPSRLSTPFSCGQQGKGQVANASQAFAEAQPLCGECKTVRICSAAALFSRFCPVFAASHAG